MFNNKFNKIPRFLFAGLLATSAHYAVMFVLFKPLEIELVIATSVGAVTGAIVNYFINYFYTFNCKRDHRQAMGNFILVVSAGMLINAAVVALIFHWLTLSPIIAQIFASILVFVWNYLAHQHWTFLKSSEVAVGV